jgi:hypothetical protein
VRTTGPRRVAFVLAMLALAIIAYIATPPALIEQATALWGAAEGQ